MLNHRKKIRSHLPRVSFYNGKRVKTAAEYNAEWGPTSTNYKRQQEELQRKEKEEEELKIKEKEEEELKIKEKEEEELKMKEKVQEELKMKEKVEEELNLHYKQNHVYHIIVPYENDCQKFLKIYVKKVDNPENLQLNTLSSDFPILNYLVIDDVDIEKMMLIELKVINSDEWFVKN